MLNRRLVGTAALTLCSATALIAGPASAATKTVYAGPNAKLPDEALTVNDFFRKSITIRQGDRVRWQMRGFHNVILPARGDKPPAFFAPDPVAKVTGVADAAGTPFWFNGQPRVQIDPRSAFPTGGRTYDGTTLTGSGLSQTDGPPPPYTLKFTKTGKFAFYCTIHEGMKGTVKVVAKGKKVPTAAQDRKAATAQLAKLTKQAAKLDDVKPPAATVLGGSDKAPVAWLKFFPKRQTVKVGQPLTFSVTGSQEPHTLTFGPEAYLKQVLEGQITPVPNPQGPPSLVFDPRVLLPSDPPPQLPPYTGANHGNGFFSTGVIGKGTPGGTKTTITFAKAGSYKYICLIHPEMNGTVDVK
ncbi:MAG: hypothetical protein H0V22_10615 [Solirubrobacterales bacterium]|nr:hypothetical protein [Solirubrobacterales bacterium]